MTSPLTDAQKAAIEIIPRIMGGISVCGSACVLLSVLWNQTDCKERLHEHHQQQNSTSLQISANNDDKNSIANRKTRRRKPTSQVAGNLLIGLSLMDLLSSMSYVVGSVMFPSGKGGKGNQATCNAQGFLCNLQVGAALYSGFLPWYYYLVLKFSRKIHGKNIRFRFEVFVHAFCWAFVVATSAVSMVKGLYNPHWIRCYISGPNTGLYFWIFFYAPIWLSMLNGTIAMTMIYTFVRQTESKTNRWSSIYQIYNMAQGAASDSRLSFDGQGLSTNNVKPAASQHGPVVGNPNETLEQNPANGTSSTNKSVPSRRLSFRPENKTPRANLPRTRRVLYQAFGYTSTFLFVYTFPTTSRIIQTMGNDPSYGIRLLAVSFIPSQGLFNWFVFFWLPRFVEWRSQRNRNRANVDSPRYTTSNYGHVSIA